MRRILFILMYLTVTCFAYEARARSCLLATQFATGDCIVFKPGFCETLGTEKCVSTGVIEYSCISDVDGKEHFYCGTCTEKSYPPAEVAGPYEQNSKKTYRCEKDFKDSACGCSIEDTKCNTDVFPHQAEDCDAAGFTNAYLGEKGACIDPKTIGKTNVKHLSSCECDRQKYPFTCSEEGFKIPRAATQTDYCKDSAGHTYYSYCDCNNNEDWVSEPCADRVDGCTSEKEQKANNAAHTSLCYHCQNTPCSIRSQDTPSNQLNLEVLYCKDNAEKIRQNCAKNGTLAEGYIGAECCAAFNYSYVGSGTCKNGSTGPLCPFDKNYMFCQAN